MGLELSTKVSMGYTPPMASGGGNVQVDVSAKATAEYNRKWGSAQTTSDTVEQSVHIVGPFSGFWQAERSRDKMQLTVTAPPVFAYKTEYFDGDRLLYSWASLDEQDQVLKGQAPNSVDLGKEFANDGRLSLTEFNAIDSYRFDELSMILNFDDVLSLTSRVKRAVPRDDS